MSEKRIIEAANEIVAHDIASRARGWMGGIGVTEAVEILTRHVGTSVSAREVVDRQANDPGLWFVPTNSTEAYLQRALRELHAAVEGESQEASVNG